MPTYENMVIEAEKAVGSVKDPELKRVAFEKVLETLLASLNTEGEKHEPISQAVRSEKKLDHSKIAARRSGPKAYLEELIEENYFHKPKTIAETRAELGNRGHHIPVTTLSGPLQSLCKSKKLRRQKMNGNGKNVYSYTNW